MDIQSQVINSLPVFKTKDRLDEVIAFFRETSYSHVAIMEKRLFVGLLAENDLEIFEKGKQIKEYRDSMESFYVRSETGWLDVLEAFARNEANIMPVLDKLNRVLGYYDLTQIMRIFIDTPFFKEPGGILVIAKAVKDYSFSEIAQIVESNNTKLLGAFITDARNDVIQITVKIGTLHVNDVVQTFRRYNYSILFGNNDDQFLENLKERSNYLNKYLNV